VKIIAIGYNTAGTGLTRVMHSVMRRLADRHEIHYLGIGYSGEVEHDRGLTIYPTNPRGGDVFAAFQAKEMIEAISPSLLFILHDIWLFNFYVRELGPYRDRLKIAAYIPLDGRIVNEMDAAPLLHVDRVIAYTQFGRAQFEGAFERLRVREAGKANAAPPPAVDIIPHGIDPHRFFPFDELTRADFDSSARLRAKQRVFGDRSNHGDGPGFDHHESFVVLNANRLDERKRVDLTVKGFAKFAAGKPPGVRLCLHHAIMNGEDTERLAALIRECGIADRVSFNPLGNRVVDDEELNWLYNACDVGINTAMGEGWGLVSCEHGAAGAAQIVPDHTACAELWRGRGELIPPARFFVPPTSVLEMGEVAPEGVARALEALYANPARRRALSRAAATAALDPAWSWDVIARQFEDLFERLAR
jgi:glycosyltransferase involved in cell wall biosynthesis